jgi:geranylgeranyl diphosphate synthase type II
LHVMAVANEAQLKALDVLLENNDADKVEKVLAIYNECGVPAWANNLKAKYMQEAFANLEEIAVVSNRKQPLIDLANYLMNRNK